MISMPAVIDVPLTPDSYGIIRIGQTRITLETLITRYRLGDSPEALHDSFPTLTLPEIYAVIAYYLVHQSDVEGYLEMVHQEGDALRHQIEAHPGAKPLTREELLRRKESH